MVVGEVVLHGWEGVPDCHPRFLSLGGRHPYNDFKFGNAAVRGKGAAMEPNEITEEQKAKAREREADGELAELAPNRPAFRWTSLSLTVLREGDDCKAFTESRKPKRVA